MKNNILKYKGYIAKVEYSVDDQCLHGKIDGISDLVTFESTDASAIEKEFQDAVDDYLALCSEIGKEPNKHYSGTFNIRIDPQIHRSLEFYATEHDLTLNAVVSEACGSFVRAGSTDSTWTKAIESKHLAADDWHSVNPSPLSRAA